MRRCPSRCERDQQGPAWYEIPRAEPVHSLDRLDQRTRIAPGFGSARDAPEGVTGAHDIVARWRGLSPMVAGGARHGTHQEGPSHRDPQNGRGAAPA